MNQFADEVKRKTGGAINVKVFPGSQLYNDQDAMAALGTGSVQMVWAGGGAAGDDRPAHRHHQPALSRCPTR